MASTPYASDRDSATEARPFIIWTLRRTGGTNLAQHVFRRSRFRSIQHEPFNKNRVFGKVSADFERDGDTAPLDRICADGILMKHCVETVPLALSLALLERSVAHGYRHLFLIRRTPGDRLVSLHFAGASGVWGARMVAQNSIDNLSRIARNTPIPIDGLLARERLDRARLLAVYERADALETRPLIAVFEDLYDYDAPSLSLARLARLTAGLGLDRAGDAADGADREILFGGGQKTQSLYALAPNHDAFRKAVSEIPPMTLGAVPDPNPAQWANFVTHLGCRIDPPRQSWRSDLLQLTGTTAPRDGWRLRLADGTVLPMETEVARSPDASKPAISFAVLDVPRDGLAGARMVMRQPSSGPSQ
ncbi:hypothetical protein ILP92_16590 [Maribius pontilimi]|uniref:Uncharacterized protein n=1 Tax=Palleronia pontilimi TaxID=1964209 RepID=A0A934IKR5_9RHOB|nr:hypothetical protein [Palleronia pontilimi]MBJ3764360.1 hypothetical protein [Palleronia pontilimi]